MVIETLGLTHRFADGRLALDGVSFSISSGESVAIIGPNGAGKTTLFLRLCGVLGGKCGNATVAGLDPADPKERRLMRRERSEKRVGETHHRRAARDEAVGWHPTLRLLI